MIDLVEYITSRYPDATKRTRLTKTGVWHCIHAVWRGDNNASFGLRWYDDAQRWRFRDFSTRQHGDIVDFLMQVEQYSKSEALRIANGGRGYEHLKPAVSARKPKVEQSIERLAITDGIKRYAAQALSDIKKYGVPDVWKRRGFTMTDCIKLGLGRDEENGVISIMRGSELINVKIRLSDTSRGKYRYAQAGIGSPAWYSPNINTATTILLLEGELNGMACYLALSALTGSEKYGVIGMAGASQPVTKEDLEVINNRLVYVMADDDQAGRDAALRWCESVPSSVGIMRPLGKQDACDVFGHYGRTVLGRRLTRRFYSLEESSGSGRDATVRSWLASSESVRSRSIEIGKSANSSTLSPLSASVVKRINYICTRFPELRRYAIAMGKKPTYVIALAIENGYVTAKSLAEFAELSISRAHEIISELVTAGLLKITWDGRTKVGRLVGNWKQLLDNLCSSARLKIKDRLERYSSIYGEQRNVFWRWVETTVQGCRWLEVHSGALRLPATSY